MSLVVGSEMYVIVDYNTNGLGITSRAVDGNVYTDIEVAREVAAAMNKRESVTSYDVEEVEVIHLAKGGV